MKKVKAIVPTLWLLGAVIAVYNAWNYYQDGNTGFVYVHAVIFDELHAQPEQTGIRFALNSTKKLLIL